MCGIYGYVGKPIKGKEKKVLSLIRSLAIFTEKRGKDSTGFVVSGEAEVAMEKALMPASEFVYKNKKMKEMILSGADVFIGHNRWASIGSVNINNAHPFLSSKYALVHNGTFAGAKNLAKSYKVAATLEGETDSEAMLACLTKSKSKKAVLSKFVDYSLVFMSMTSGKVFFARDDKKPMFIFDLRDTLGIYVFASEVVIFEKAVKRARLMTLLYKEKEVSYARTAPWYLYGIQNGKVDFFGPYEKPNKLKREVGLRSFIM